MKRLLLVLSTALLLAACDVKKPSSEQPQSNDSSETTSTSQSSQSLTYEEVFTESKRTAAAATMANSTLKTVTSTTSMGYSNIMTAEMDFTDDSNPYYHTETSMNESVVSEQLAIKEASDYVFYSKSVYMPDVIREVVSEETYNQRTGSHSYELFYQDTFEHFFTVPMVSYGVEVLDFNLTYSITKEGENYIMSILGSFKYVSGGHRLRSIYKEGSHYKFDKDLKYLSNATNMTMEYLNEQDEVTSTDEQTSSATIEYNLTIVKMTPSDFGYSA